MPVKYPGLFYQGAENLTYDQELLINNTISTTRVVYTYYPIFLVVIGIPANALTINILRSSQVLRANFVSVFLAYLSVYNIINLLVGLSRFFFIGVTGTDIWDLSIYVARSHSAVSIIAHTVSNWILTSLSICKLMYIVYPYQANIWCGKNITHIVMMCILTLVCLSVGAFSGGFKKVVIDEKPSFDTHNHYMQFSRTKALLQAMSFFYVPCGIIILINGIIVFLYARSLRQATGASRLFRKHLQAAHRFAIITLLCDIEIMIMEFPYAYLFTERARWLKGDIEEKTMGHLFYCVATMMLYTNYSANFVVYCFFGNHYRRQLISILKPCLGDRIQLSPSQSSECSSYICSSGTELRVTISLKNILSDPALLNRRHALKLEEKQSTMLSHSRDTQDSDPANMLGPELNGRKLHKPGKRRAKPKVPRAPPDRSLKRLFSFWGAFKSKSLNSPTASSRDDSLTKKSDTLRSSARSDVGTVRFAAVSTSAGTGV